MFENDFILLMFNWQLVYIGECFMGEFQFCKIKIVLEMDDNNGCTTLRMYLVPVNCSLKNGLMINFVY